MSNNSNQRLEELRQKRNEAKLGGGLKKQEAIRKTGRGTARDRIGMLLDEDSFSGRATEDRKLCKVGAWTTRVEEQFIRSAVVNRFFSKQTYVSPMGV